MLLARDQSTQSLDDHNRVSMSNTVSTAPQYSRMLDETGVEVQQQHEKSVGESELTPLNPLAQQPRQHLLQKPAADGPQIGKR